MKEILNHLFEHRTLSKEQAKEVLKDIASGKYNNSQITAFITSYIMRSITVEELEGFRDAMLELCLFLDLSEYNPIDLCGTGGDNKNTFNISTLSSFVVAGSGIKVAKHGNYAVSSTCGSSNVLEYLGYKFTNDKSILKRNIEEAGICFLHAPLFHPAMKTVAPIRKELGVKTFFNILGPMVNPSFPKRQIVGVFNLELTRLYSYLYQKSDKDYVILHSLDGYDEVSLTSSFKMISKEIDRVLEPEELKMRTLMQEEILGGKTIAESADIFIKILNCEGTEAQENVVIANSGMAIYCANPQISLSDAMEIAKESIKSKKALQSFKKFVS
jgi:anthranilate phosphoribosyltransferase